jgi:PAS domain S-box-containing protein
LVRFKRVYEPIITPLVFLGIIGISVVWIFNGGINGSNIMVAYAILVLGLIIVPRKNKIYVIVFFIVVNVFILLIQFYRPDIIVNFPTETDRWIDNLIALIYSSFFIYLTLRFVHNNYTIEKLKAEANERKFQSLSENSADYIARFDMNNRIIYVNKSKIDFIGLPINKIIGRTQTDLNLFDSKQNAKWENILVKVFELKEPISEQFIIEYKENIKYLDCKFFPEFDSKNIIESVLSVSRDITYLKQSEIKLAQLNNDKDKFMSILAHDLKSPFSSILGFLDLLSRNIRKYDIEKIEKLINQIHKSAKNTFNLLEELLLWINSQSGKLQFVPIKFKISELITTTVFNMKFLAETKEIDINYSSNDEIIVFADMEMIKMVLRNLVSNAIKFTKQKGEVDIIVALDKYNAVITISDNGVGIDPDNRNELFNISKNNSSKLGTANEPGTGLGLILCKEFVEKNNGQIWVESELEKGSKFSFTIPLYK